MIRRRILLAATLAAILALCIAPAPAYAPPVIIAVAVYAATASVVYAAIAALAVQVLMSFLAQPSKPDQQGPQAQGNNNPAITVRQPAAPRQMIFGRFRTGGIYTFMHVTGTDNATLHMVVTLSGHPVRSIDVVSLVDQVLTLDADGNCTASGPLVPIINPDPNATTPPNFSGKVRCVFATGTTEGDAAFMAALKADCPDKWTDAHRQSGCAKAYLKMDFDRNVFPGGIPNPSFIVTGYNNVIDPRLDGSPAQSAWTDNAALCAAQYFRDAQLALGYSAGEIADDALIAAANSCDEIVARGGPFAFTADPVLDKLTFLGGGGFSSAQPLYFQNTGGALPGGLAADTPYYWIADVDDPTVGQVSASTVTGGQPGPAVNLTDAGSGTNTAVVRTAFTVDSSTGLVTLADLGSALRCGTRLTVASVGGALPTGLAAATEYFWTPVTLTTGKFASSLANARAYVAVPMSDNGSGTLRLTADGEPRYTLNGTIDTSKDPHTVIPDLLSAMAGTKTDSGGKVVLFAGVWPGVGPIFDESMLDAGVTTSHRRSRRDVFNGQKGTFFNPDNGWQSTDYPAVQIDSYVTEDSGLPLWKDAPLPFTHSPTACQRISRIAVERVRRQISAGLSLKLHGLQTRAGRVIGITNAKRGLTAKTFEVVRWGFADRNASQNAGPSSSKKPPRLGIDISAQELDANVFAWDPSVHETAMRPAPTTNMPTAFKVPPVTNVQLASGTDVLGERLDGTIFSRILVTWDPPPSVYVTSGGFIDIQYRKILGSPSLDWTPFGSVRGDQTQTFILDVDDGDVYQVMLIARAGSTGAASDPVLSAAHTVLGKSLPPSDVTGFSATQNGISVNFRADHIADLDLDRIEVRRLPAGVTDWDRGQPTANILRGQAIATEAVPPGSWTFLAKAYDSSQNQSANAARFDLTITNPNTVLATEASEPDWLNLAPAGSPSPSSYGFVLHPNGSLVPQDKFLAATYGDELFDEFVPNPLDGPLYYEATDIDLGKTGTVRFFSLIGSQLGPGETTGFADASLEIDYRSDAGAFMGFMPFVSGSITARYIKSRLKMLPASGKGFVSSFDVTADAQIRTEYHNGVAIGVSPAPLVFDIPFFQVPSMKVTPQGATGLVGQPIATSATQGTPGLFSILTGAAASGSANIEVTGV